MSRAFVKLGLERLETRWMLAADAVPLDDVYTLEPGTALDVPADCGVLVNEDLQFQMETAELVNGPSHGELTFRADGSFIYKADESFPGIDTFTYRIADSTSEENLATVTLGLAESLDDIVKFRMEIVNLDGNPVKSAPVGALLEVRVFVQEVPERPNIGPVLAFYSLSREGVVPVVEASFGVVDGYLVIGARDPAGVNVFELDASVLDAAVLNGGENRGALRFPADLDFQPGEQLIARTLFTAGEAGTLSLATQPFVKPNEYGVWPVRLGDGSAELLRNRLQFQFVAHGQIEYGDAVSVEFTASSNTPPVEDTDIYHVDETGVLEVDAASGVLANDTDADGDTLTARIVRQPLYGQVTLNTDGSFRYVQDSNGNNGSRLELFSYIVDDGVAARVGLAMLVLPSGEPVSASWQNRANPIDVDGDGVFTSDDEWILVHELEKNGEYELPPPSNIEGPPPFLDVNGDGVFSHADLEALYADYVRFRLQPVSLDGSPIDQVTVGESFAVQVRVEDLRDDPCGVFAAYLDVEYDPALVTLDGELQFGDVYINDVSGDTSSPGLIDEAGAFSDSIEPLGGGEFTVFTARFTATAAGEVVFSGNPADDTPARDVNVYGWDFNLSDGQTGFEDGSVLSVPNSWIAVAPASLSVVAATDFAQDDSVVVEHGGSPSTLDLLANDDAVLIVAVTRGSAGGEVSISTDGLRVIYTHPSDDFIGVETFQYTAQNSDGATDVATVTVRVRSRFQNPSNPLDTNDDGYVSPLDALIGINQLNEKGPRELTDDDMLTGGTRRYLDVNGDGAHSAIDVLIIVNHLNATVQGDPEGEFSPLEADVPLPATEPILAGQAAAIAVTTQTAFNGTATLQTVEDRRLLASFSPSVVEDGASGSLREVFAIAAANGQADEIRLGTGVYRLDLSAEGDLDISESGLGVRIVGAGRGQTVIDATGLGDRAFDVWEGAVLELEGLTILAGEVNDDGAGIRNAGTLTLRDVEIAGGTANGDGGAIFNSGTAQLESVRLVGNVALRGGGLANGPGAQLVGDELEVLSNTAFWPSEYKKNFNGAFGVGGGVMNWGDMELSHVQLISNHSDNFGGGIQNDRFLMMNHALLAENSAPVGSAIYSFRESPSLGSTPAETVLDDIALRGNTSAWDRDPVEQWYDTTVSATNVVEVDAEAGFLAREAAFTVLEDSSENSLPLGAFGWNSPITAALTRSGATATVSDNELVLSPQPDFCGLDLVVVVDANGVPHPIDVWVEPQNDPFTIDFPESIQVFTWEQAYLDPPFENLTKAPYEVSIPVLENASYAPDIGERLTITSVFASHGGTVGIWDPNELTSREPESWPDDRAWINYSPAAGFSGVETITYTVSDGNGAVSEFTVQAHVEGRDDVMQFRLEARNSAGEVVDRVRQGETIDVYVYVTSGLNETAIRSADAEIRYHPSQVERVGDVQFGDALPDLQWWGDTKSSGIPDLRTLGMKANGGFNVFDDPHQDLILAQFSLQVVGNQMVELAFDAKDCTGNLYDLGPATNIPYAAIEFVGLSLPVVAGWHNAELPADVDGNQSVVPLDALILVNELNRGGSRLLSEPAEGEGESLVQSLYYDVNDDGYLTPLDAVQVVNILNGPASEAEGEDAAKVVLPALSAFGQIAASPDPARLMSRTPSAALGSEAIGLSQDELLDCWRRSPANDNLLDVLAIARGNANTDGDALWEASSADLLAADELLELAMVEVLSRDRIVSQQEAPSDHAIHDMHDRDLVGGKRLDPRQACHR